MKIAKVLALGTTAAVLWCFQAAADCGGCGNVCLLRIVHHCVKQGHDPTCEVKRTACLKAQQAAEAAKAAADAAKALADKIAKASACVNGIVKTAGVTAACGGCVVGTDGAGLAACVAPCSTDVQTIQSAKDQCR
jgi:hypothetical protein